MTAQRLFLATATGFGIVATMVFMWSTPSQAQLAPGANRRDEHQPFIMSGSLIVVVSPKNDAVFAYSKHTGTWQKQSVETPPKKPILPTVSSEVAVFQTGNKFYAFSGTEGRWDALTLDEGVQPDWHIMHEMAFVYLKNEYHVFSAKTANWASLSIRKAQKSVD